MKKAILIFLVIFNVFLFANQNIKVEIVHLNKKKLPGINLSLRYTDVTNGYLSGLKKKDFIVFFNNEEIDFKLVEQKSALYVSTLVLIDASRSIKKDKRQLIRVAAKSFINKMKQGDKAALFIFHDRLIKLTDFTSDKTKLIKCIDTFQAGGDYSRLYDSIIKSVKYINQNVRFSRKSILVLGDGYDENSNNNIDEAISVAKQFSIPIYSQGYTNVKKRYLKILKKISNETGGLFSREDELDPSSRIFARKKEYVYSFSFKISDPKKENYITVRLLKYNKDIKIKLLFDKQEIYKANKPKRMRLYAIVGILLLLLLILLIIFLIKWLSKRKKLLRSKSDRVLLNFNDLQRKLISKVIESQVSGNDPDKINFYKNFFAGDKVNADSVLKLSENIEEYLTQTESLSFEETKVLEKTIENLKKEGRISTKTFSIKNFVTETLLSKIITSLKLKQPSSAYEIHRKKIKEDVPELKTLLEEYEKEEQPQKLTIDNFVTAGSEKEFDMLMETFLIRAFYSKMDGFEIEKILQDLYELDEETVSKLIPYMVHLVMESEGFERDINLSILKKMAQKLNLDWDNISDLGELEDWWKNNKEKISDNLSLLKDKKGNQELENGLITHEEILLYAVKDDDIIEFPAKIIGGDKYSVVFVCENKLLLDKILCFYRPGLDTNDNILSEDNYIFLRLIEISVVDNHAYRLVTYFVSPNQRNESEVQRLIEHLIRV